MGGFLAEWRAGLSSPVTVYAWVFISVLMAIAGPFGSYDHIGFGTRLLMWGGVAAGAIALAVGIRTMVYGVMGLRDYWRGATATAALVCVIVSYPVKALTAGLSVATGFAAPAMTEIGAFVFFLTMGFCAFRHAAEPAVRGMADPPAIVPPATSPAVPVAEPAEPAPIRLLARIDPDLRGRPIRMQVRDHYVDLVTDRGTASVLIRFSDAIAEMDGVDGMQVHRSHWVAADAVTAVDRAGARMFLRLSDGSRIPVSDRHRKHTEARWPSQV